MKKILTLLTILMVLAVPALATPTPLPIVGLVSYSDGTPAQNVLVTVVNQMTSVQMTGYTGTDGKYTIEWANSQLPPRGTVVLDKDVFQITVLGSTQAKVYASGDMDVRANFALGIVPPPVVCPEPVVCPDPVICAECPTCPIQNPYNLNDMIMAIVGAGAVTAVGITAVKSNGTVTVTTKHKHAGVTGLHSINTMHSNRAYRHAKGDINPTVTVDGKPFPLS